MGLLDMDGYDQEAEEKENATHSLAITIINEDVPWNSYDTRCAMARGGSLPSAWATFVQRYINGHPERLGLTTVPPASVILAVAAEVADYYETHVREN